MDTGEHIQHLPVAVVMRHEPVVGAMARWQSHRWVLDEVVPDQPAFGTQPQRLREAEGRTYWLHPGLVAALHPEDAEGYYLNITTEQPCWFVMWRLDDDGTGPARPLAVSLSYHDAGRWLDAQETVEQVPLPPALVQTLRDYVATHHRPEVKRRQRPQSFQPLRDRFGNPASISTDKTRRGGGGPGEGGA